MKYKSHLSISIALLSSVLFTAKVSATESGGSVYPLGVQTVVPGIMLAPGNYLLNYNTLVNSNSLNDNQGNSSLPNAKLRVEAHALRYIHVFNGITFANADVGFEAAAAYTRIKLTAHAAPFLNIDSRDNGIGDLTLGPSLGWHGRDTHELLTFLVTLPTGAYDANRGVNAGRNYTALQLSYGVTHFIYGLEISAMFKGIYNFKNHATHYKSGAESDMDYGINYHFRSPWFVGVGGYWHEQLTDDTVNGQSVNGNGNRVREFTAGPQVGYGSATGGIYLSVTHKFYARNTSNGNQIWLNDFIKF